MPLYNTATNLQAQGKFAPGVSYRADIRKPVQSLPDIEKPKSVFNIDLRGIGEAISDISTNQLKLDIAAMKDKKANGEKVAKATFLNNIASELMKNETAADQGVYDTTTLDRMQRSVLDRGLAAGGALGISAKDIYALAPNYGPTAMKATKDRNDWHDNIREEDQKLANDFVKNVPSAAKLPYSQQVYAARTAQQATDAFTVSQQRYNADPSEANKMLFTADANNIGNIQAHTVLNNYLNSVADGSMSPSEAKLQVHNNLLNTFSNLDPSLALYMTKRVEDQNKELIDLAGNITKEEAAIFKNQEDIFTASVRAHELEEHPELIRDYAFGGDLTLALSNLNMSPVVTLDEPLVREEFTYTKDGKTVAIPQLSLDLYTGGTDVTGRHIAFDLPLTGVEARKQLTGVTDFMKLYSRTKAGVNTPNMNRAAARSIIEASSANNVVNRNFDKLSSEDRKTALNNTRILNNVTGDIYESNLISGGQETAAAQIRQNRTNYKGGTILNNYGLADNTELMSTFDNLYHSRYLIDGIRISKQGDLLLQDDMEGIFNSTAQTVSGLEYKQNAQKINSILTEHGLTPDQKRAVIETKLGRPIEDWDGNEGYSTEPTTMEQAGYLLQQGANKAWAGIQRYVANVANSEKTKKFINASNEAIASLGNTIVDWTNKFVDEYQEKSSEILPEWNERFNQMSTEFKEQYQKLSEEAKESLKNRYETYREAITGDNPSVEQLEEVTSEMIGADKQKMSQIVTDKIEKGIPVAIAVPSAAYETMPKEKKDRALKMVSNTTDKSKEEIEAGISGILEGIEVAGSGLGSPYRPLGIAFAGTEIFANGGYTYNAAADALNMAGSEPGGLFNQVLTASFIGAHEVSRGAEASIIALYNMLYNTKPIKFDKDLEPSTITGVYIDPREAYEQILTDNGEIVLGTETLEELKERADKY